MDGSSVSANDGSSSWQSYDPFEVTIHLRNYARSLDARLFQAMPVCGDSLTVDCARYGGNYDTGIDP